MVIGEPCIIEADPSAAKHETVIGIGREIAAAIAIDSFCTRHLELGLHIAADADVVQFFQRIIQTSMLIPGRVKHFDQELRTG